MNVKRENLSCIFIVLFVVKVSNYLLVVFFMGCGRCKVFSSCFGFDI